MTPAHKADTPDESRHSAEDCLAVNSILSRVGDKWSMLIVVLLGERPRRFSEIKRLVEGISQRMLTRTLRGLERDGFVTRTVFATIPPRVDYGLTELGHSLRQPVETLGLWVRGHLVQIEAARRQFDQRSEAD